MGRTHKKLLIGILSVLMIALITSTATTTVADGDWGNLKTGDEMKWKAWPDPIHFPDLVIYFEMEIVGISGTHITYAYKYTAVSDSTTSIISSGTTTDEDYAVFVYAQSYLQEMKAEAEDDPNKIWTETNFNWEGTNYKTYNYKYTTSGGDTYEMWIDQGTGILLEEKKTTGGTTYTLLELQSTTASLTRARRFCMGTILIALVSVVTLISYSLIRYRKNKKI